MNVPGFIPSNRLIPDIGPIDGSFGSLASITEDELDTYYRANFGDESKGPRYYRLITGSSGGDRELALKNFLQAYLACISFFVDDQIVRVLDVLENGRAKLPVQKLCLGREHLETNREAEWGASA